MALKYRDDPGLAVLALADEGDLGRLADLLTYDEADGEAWNAQQLLKESAFNEARAAGRLRPVWQLLAAELQSFAGDSVVNKFRSVVKDHSGVPYEEILEDAAGYVGADLGEASGVRAREAALVQQLLQIRYFPKGQLTLSPPSRAAAREAGCPALVDGSLTAETLPARLADDEDFFMAAIGALRRLPQFPPKVSVASLLIKGPASLMMKKQSATGTNFGVTLPGVLEVARIRRKTLRNPMNLSEI